MGFDIDSTVNQRGMHRGKEIDLKRLAIWDFRLDWAAIAMLVLGPSWVPLWMFGLRTSLMFVILVTLAVASWGWAVWCTDRIMVELKDRFHLRLSFWLMAPCFPLALIFMGVIAARAGGVLTRHGVKVGFFGITRRTLKELSPGMCRFCGYDIRAIQASVCPECGVAIERA